MTISHELKFKMIKNLNKAKLIVKLNDQHLSAISDKIQNFIFIHKNNFDRLFVSLLGVIDDISG